MKMAAGIPSAYKLLRLYTASDKFYVEPLDPDASSSKILEIDRVTQELVLTENRGQIQPSTESKEICGLLGIIHLVAGPYLIVITKRRLVGLLNGHEIWRIYETDIIPFPKTTLHLTEEQTRDNKIYLQMVQSVLQQDSFYFSYTYDLTHSLQRLNNTTPDFSQMPLFERADARFVWNHHLMRIMSVQPELYRFVFPVMQGFVSIKKCTVKQYTFDYILISRRTCYRAGTRFYVRGLDNEGQVANFVETEQIVCFQGDMASYVQTRGSIPLFWSQRPNLKYKPSPAIVKAADHLTASRLHLDNLLVYYGSQVLINLIDQKGSEKALGDRFESTIKTLNYSEDQVRYIAFDFHKECSKMRWHRLSILMDKINHLIDKFEYFKVDRNKASTKMQVGIFRTNCMDCLDRTNVVQSLIARVILQKQLIDMKIIEPGEQVDNFSLLEYTFKNVWADNADACSLQYSGTGALKTDFTRLNIEEENDLFLLCIKDGTLKIGDSTENRTGKRTKWGLLQDGINSLMRYYKNNFADGFRQDSIDLLLGNYLIDPSNKKSPFKEETDWKYLALPVILLIGISMLFISLLIPSTDYGLQLLYVMFWAIACVITLYFVMLYGTEFVNQPRLAQRLKEVVA